MRYPLKWSLVLGLALAVVAGAARAGEACPSPPPLTAGQDVAMRDRMTAIDAAFRNGLPGYQFGLWPGKMGRPPQPDDLPTLTEWSHTNAILSCTNLTVYYTYDAKWLLTPADGDLGHEWANEVAMNAGKDPPYAGDGQVDDLDDPNYAAIQQQRMEAQQKATLTLEGNLTPDMFEALHDDEHPDISPYPAPSGAVAAFSQDDINHPGQIHVFVLLGPWSQVRNDYGKMEFRPSAAGFTSPVGANAVKLTITGDPGTVATFLHAFDGGKMGL